MLGIQYKHESKEDIAGFISKLVARPEYGTIYQHKGMLLQNLHHRYLHMFGEMDIDDIDLSEMEMETTQDLHKEAEAAEAASTAIETGATSKDKITKVTSLPVPLELESHHRISQKWKVLKRGLLKTLTCFNIK